MSSIDEWSSSTGEGILFDWVYSLGKAVCGVPRKEADPNLAGWINEGGTCLSQVHIQVTIPTVTAGYNCPCLLRHSFCGTRIWTHLVGGLCFRLSQSCNLGVSPRVFSLQGSTGEGPVWIVGLQAQSCSHKKKQTHARVLVEVRGSFQSLILPFQHWVTGVELGCQAWWQAPLHSKS